MKINRSGIQQSPYGRCETKHTYNTNRYKNACIVDTLLQNTIFMKKSINKTI